MNILTTYIRKYLLMNKSTTCLSILSLISASALFYVVVCLCVNTVIGFHDSIVNSFGNYHAVYRNADAEFGESLELHAQISQIDKVNSLDKIEMDCFLSKGKDSFSVIGMDFDAFDDLGLTLAEGNYPSDENEILVSKEALSDSKISLDLYETLFLNEKEYTVVGIMEDPFFDYESSFYTLLTVPDDSEMTDYYVRYYNQKESRKISEQIAFAFQGQFAAYELNMNYLFFHFADGNWVYLFIALFAVSLLMIFMAMNLLLIRNCYKNSYANREKHLAILKTVGVTQSQCTTMILYEGILLLVISLLIGSFAGWFMYEMLIGFLNGLLHSVSVQSFTIGKNFREAVLLLSIVYVTAAALFFIRRSTKKIIMQSVSITLQSSDEVQVMEHPYLQLEKKQSIFVRLFKKNIRQNHRSYRHLIIGVTSVLTLFILINSFMGYLREGGFFDINDHNYDVEVIVRHDSYPTQLMTQLKNRTDASSVVISEVLLLQSNDFSGLDENYSEHTLLSDMIPFEVIAYSDEIIRSFSAKSVGDVAPLFDEEPCGLLINQMYSSAHRRFYDILKENVIHDLFYQDQLLISSLNLIETDLLITGTSYQKNPQIIVTRELFRQIQKKAGVKEHEYHVFFQSSDSASLVRELNILNDGSVADYEVINAQAALKDGKIMITLVRILSYGYVLCLILMGILATCCVASVNFDYRKKEFMLYRALGLRMKEMMCLIFAEILYYGIQIFAIAWLISQILNYVCYEIYFKNLGLQFFIPEESLIGSVLSFVIVLFTFMCYIYIRMRTQKYSLILKNEISMM